MDTDTLNTDKLAKLLALASSPNDAEALSALRMARAELIRVGMDFKDVANRMAQPAASRFDKAWDAAWDSAWAEASRTQQPPPKPKGYTVGGFTFESKEAYEDFCRQEREQREAERQRHAPKREAVLAKYGSAEAAIARDAREQTLHDAALPWLEGPHVPDDSDYAFLAGRWHESMGGWKRYNFTKKPAPECIAALEAAMPLPKTITEAHAEYLYWEERNDEIEHALECYGDEQLDLPAAFRRERVRNLLETELQASNLDEVLIRQRHLVERESSMPEVELAVLADLERLAQMLAAPVQNGHDTGATTARARRAEVLRLLSNMDTAGL
jgi:hypothetical protein